MFQFWQLLAGLGIFIFAMRILEQGLRGLSTRRLRNLLRSHTHPPLQGVLVGTVSTAFAEQLPGRPVCTGLCGFWAH